MQSGIRTSFELCSSELLKGFPFTSRWPCAFSRASVLLPEKIIFILILLQISFESYLS